MAHPNLQQPIPAYSSKPVYNPVSRTGFSQDTYDPSQGPTTDAYRTPDALQEVKTEESDDLTLTHVKVDEPQFVVFFDKYLATLDDK